MSEKSALVPVDRAAVLKSLERLGFKVTDKSAVPDASLNKGKEGEGDDLLIKGLGAVSESVLDLREKFEKSLEGLGNNLTKADVEDVLSKAIDTIEEKFSDLAIIEKAVSDKLGEVMEVLTGMNNIVKSLNEEVEAIAKTPNNPKSFRTKDFVEKSFVDKGNEGLQKGEVMLSASKDRDKILDIMEKACGDLEKAGDNNPMVEAMLSFEASGALSDLMIGSLRRDHKIVIIP